MASGSFFSNITDNPTGSQVLRVIKRNSDFDDSFANARVLFQELSVVRVLSQMLHVNGTRETMLGA